MNQDDMNISLIMFVSLGVMNGIWLAGLKIGWW